MYSITSIYFLLVGIVSIQASLDPAYQRVNVFMPSGIYFEAMPRVYRVKEYWNLVGHIDVAKFKLLLRRSGELNFSGVYHRCMNVTSNCDQSLRIHKILERERRIGEHLQALEETLSHYPEAYQETEDFNDWFLNSTASIELPESQVYSDNFNKAQSYGDTITCLEGNKTILIRSDLDHERDVIRMTYDQLKTMVEKLYKMKKGKHFSYTDYRNLLANFSSRVEEVEERFLTLLQDAQQVILSTKIGQLHPKAMIPRMLKHCLGLLHTFTYPSKFPFPLNRTSLGDLEKVSKMRTSVFDGKFIFQLSVPVMESAPYYLYAAHPHPTHQVVDKRMITYGYVNPQSKYLLVTKDKMMYTPFTQTNLNRCPLINSFFLCPEIPILTPTKQENQCEISLLLNPTPETYQHCQIKLKKILNHAWTPLLLNDGWIYTFAKREKGQISCSKNETKEVKLSNIGGIRIRPDCTLNISGTLLTGQPKAIGKIEKDVIPAIEMDVHQVFPEIDLYEYEFNTQNLNSIPYDVDLQELKRSFARLKTVYTAP